MTASLTLHTKIMMHPSWWASPTITIKYYPTLISAVLSNPAWFTDTLRVLPIRHRMPRLPKEVNISLQPSVRYAQTVFKRSQRSLTRLFSTNCQGWFKDFTARLRKLDMQSTKNHLGIASAKTLKFLESGWCDLAGVEIFGPSDNRMQKASRECWIISEQQRLEYDHQNDFHHHPGQGQAL